MCRLQNKIKSFVLIIILSTIACCVFTTCRYDKGTPDYHCYPDAVGKIIHNKCATSGCHTNASKGGAGNLSLETWNDLFAGGSGSACVIPYRHDFSTLCYYVNSYPDLGIAVSPTMPFNKPALSHDEVATLEKWIDAGAPGCDGFVKFSDNPNRKKFYVANQGCDVVTVFDEATMLPMRYINIGNSPAIESPHDIQVSPDGKYWYVIFIGGTSIQKYRTSDDGFVGEAILNTYQFPFITGEWSTFAFNTDGSKAYITDWSNTTNCDIAEVDLNNLTVTHHLGFNGPHGSCVSPDGLYLYASQQNNSSQIYKILLSDFDNNIGSVNLYASAPPSTYLNSHQIVFAPTSLGNIYYVTCQGTSEVRVMQYIAGGNDTLIRVISVGANPSEMDVSSDKLFVTCEEDSLTFAGKMGSVYIIDMTTNQLYTSSPSIYTGHQPHGIAVDMDKNLVYVANRNKTIGGPAPHHTSVCSGKDGYITIIDIGHSNYKLLQTTTGTDKRIEVSVDPYEIAIRR